jgi:hypothetical protein
MIALPEELRCRASIRGEPLAGIPLFATFGVVAKNSYSFIFGPTDFRGIAALAKADILSLAQEQADFALMDYHPLEFAFSGGISLRAVSHENARRALEAFSRFQAFVGYPKGYEEMLQSAIRNPVLRETSSITLTRLP